MIELRGKYGEAKVYTDVVDNESISQVINLLNQPYVEGSRVRMMPDIHAGAGCTIGTTMTIQDKICPNLVGVDIGCGMETIRIKEKHIELQSLDKLIRNEIPSGFAIRNKPHRYNEQIDLDSLYCAKHIKLDRARLSVGTLGGGNHFIEANKDDDGNIYIVVHSGSRHLGLEIANYYQEAGYKALTSFNKAEIDAVIAQLKSDGRQSEIQKVLKGIKKHTSQDGEVLLIPINMRDGSLVCVGKGNEDWNCSAPHGAGRLMSRSAAKETFTVSEFKKQMEGIYTTSVSRSTLDECPMAYKRIEDIVDNISPTVDIKAIIKPIYNFKAGEES